MEVSLLQSLGQIAGVGGIALGVFLFLFRDALAKMALPAFGEENAYKLVRLFLILVAAIAGFGLFLWAMVAIFVGDRDVGTEPDPVIEVAVVGDQCAKTIESSSEASEAYVRISTKCDLDDAGVADAAEASIQAAYSALMGLSMSQSYYFMPAFKDYAEDPTAQKWALVIEEVQKIDALVETARESLEAYTRTLSPTEAETFNELHGLIHERRSLLLFFQDEKGELILDPQNRKTPEEFDEFAFHYQMLIGSLSAEVRRVYDAMQQS